MSTGLGLRLRDLELDIRSKICDEEQHLNKSARCYKAAALYEYCGRRDSMQLKRS